MTSIAANQPVAHHQLESLLAENESLRRQLQHAQRLASVGTMTAMIVHEFNNILTPIINYAQLATGGDPELVEKAIRKAADGGQRATDICNALLGLLRDRSTEPTRESIAEMIEQAVLAMGRNPGKDGITLDFQIPTDLTATVRPGEFKQVIVNLLLNARSAMLGCRGGRLTIRAERQGQRVAISLADTGTGIAPDHMDHLFEPFFTTKTAEKGGEAGTGLGLALCRELISKMDGAIWAESTLGEGATFFIELPV